MGETIIGEREVLLVRRQWEREVLPKLERDRGVYEAVRSLFQQVSEGRLAPKPDLKTDKRKSSFAEERRQRFEHWYHSIGFSVTVPKPNVSNREFARRLKLGQSLFYRPDSAGMTYEGFMAAVGQGNHWTVTNEADRAKIGWDSASAGYWFWAEVPEDCPRLRTSWNDLSQAVNLLSLEEYVIVWHAHKAETDKMLDRRFWTWLRTRFGQGALDAGECGGRVRVRRGGPESLAVSDGFVGGRAAEVVTVP